MKKLFILLTLLLVFTTGCSNHVNIKPDQQALISYNLANKQVQTIYKNDNINFSIAKLSPNGENILLVKRNTVPGNVIYYTILSLVDHTTNDYTVEMPNPDTNVVPIIASGEIRTAWLNNKQLFNPNYNVIFDLNGTNKKVCEIPQNHIQTGYIQDLNQASQQLILVHSYMSSPISEEVSYWANWYNCKGALVDTKDLNITGYPFIMNGSCNQQGMLLNYAKKINNQPMLYTSYINFDTNEISTWAKNTTTTILHPEKPLLASIPYNIITQLLGDEEGDIIAVYDVEGNKIQGFKPDHDLPRILYPEWLSWSDDGSEIYLLVSDNQLEHTYLMKATINTDQETMELLLELPYLAVSGGIDEDNNIYLLVNPATGRIKG